MDSQESSKDLHTDTSRSRRATPEEAVTFFEAAVAGDGGEGLSLETLTAVLREEGYSGPQEEVQSFFHEVNKSKSGKISMDEYMEAMGHRPQGIKSFSVARRIFCTFDADGNGVITAPELRAALTELQGTDVSEEQAASLLASLDADHDGQVTFDEFLQGLAK